MNFILIEKFRNNLAKAMLAFMMITMVIAGTGVFKPTMGIEFTGGVSYSLSAPISDSKAEFDGMEGVTVSGNTSSSTVNMISDSDLTEKQLAFLNHHSLSRDTIGASLGNELVEASLFGMGLAFLGVMLYLSFRYNSVMAVSTLVALVHDVVFTGLVLTLLGVEISSIVVGALLAIIGYSINDSVVTLDRVRELIREEDEDPVNNALQMTLRRNIITAVSTLIVIVALFLFGGEAMYAFSITMLAGVGVGMFSSLTIVPYLVSLNKKGGAFNITKAPSPEGEL